MRIFKQKMINEMCIRGLSSNTQRNYLLNVEKFIKFFNKLPEFITLDDIYYFQLFLKNNKKVPWNTFNLYVNSVLLYQNFKKKLEY